MACSPPSRLNFTPPSHRLPLQRSLFSLLPLTTTQSRHFFPSPTHFQCYSQHNHHSWALGQLLSGQHPLTAHLHATHRRSSPICPVCMQTPETLVHYLLECPAFAQQRATYLGLIFDLTLPPSQQDLSRLTATHQGLNALDQYIITSRRFFHKPWLAPTPPSSPQPSHQR